MISNWGCLLGVSRAVFLRRHQQFLSLTHRSHSRPAPSLASRMHGQEIEARVTQVLFRNGSTGVVMPDPDLVGEWVPREPAASTAGLPRVPYLKHAFSESREGVVERWGETPTWHSSRAAGAARVIVGSTVQHAAIAHPTDSRCWRLPESHW